MAMRAETVLDIEELRRHLRQDMADLRRERLLRRVPIAQSVLRYNKRKCEELGLPHNFDEVI
jgi:hypothetical protein